MNTRGQPDIKVKPKKVKYFTQTKDFLMLFLGIICVIYLLNFTFGFVEILPDNIPFIGNIDEALATGILISVFQYFNIDITSWLKRK